MMIPEENGKVKKEDFSLIKKAMPVAISSFDDENCQSVNARDLHAFMGVGRKFSDWIKDAIDKNEFVEGVDFTNHKIVIGKNVQYDYMLHIDIAKQIAMVQNNDKGKLVRKYFIWCEKELKSQQHQISDINISDPSVVLKYLEIGVYSAKKVVELQKQNDVLYIENQTQKVELAHQKPLVDHLKQILDSDTLITVSVIAQKLNITPQALNKFLIEQGVIKKNGKDGYLLKCDYIGKGWGGLVTIEIPRQDGSIKLKELLKYTALGRKEIMELWEKSHAVDDNNFMVDKRQ